MFAQWLGRILQELFLCTSVDREFPVVFRPWNIRRMWFFSANLNGWIPHLGKVAINLLDSIKISLSWCRSECWHHCHDNNCNVESPQPYCPLKLSDQRLVLLYAFFLKKCRIINLGMISFHQWRCDLELWSKHALIWHDELIDVLARCETWETFFVTKEIASQVELGETSTFPSVCIQ